MFEFRDYLFLKLVINCLEKCESTDARSCTEATENIFQFALQKIKDFNMMSTTHCYLQFLSSVHVAQTYDVS